MQHLFPGEIGGFQREESQDIIRDIDWSTRNVMLGYDVAGSTLKSFFSGFRKAKGFQGCGGAMIK